MIENYILINGLKITGDFQNKTLEINKGKVIIDGFEIKVPTKESNKDDKVTKEDITLRVVSNTLMDIKIQGCKKVFIEEDVNGKLEVNSSSIIVIGNVNNKLNVSNNLTCNGNIVGDVTVGNNLTCGDIKGNVNTDNNVTCMRDITGDVSSGNNVTCRSVQGNITANNIVTLNTKEKRGSTKDISANPSKDEKEDVSEKIKLFSQWMDKELKSNDYKGDWLNFKNVDLILKKLEISQKKLIPSIKSGDKNKQKEYIADCANFYLMLANSLDLM